MPALFQLGNFVLQNAQAVAQGRNETLLFILNDFGYKPFSLCLRRVGRCHEVEHKTGGLEQDRAFESEHLGMAHRAAHNPSKDITTAFVGRQNAVSDQVSGCTAVVGHDAHGDIVFLIVSICLAGKFFDISNDVTQQVGVVV